MRPLQRIRHESIDKELYSPNYEYLSQALTHVKICGPNSWQAILDVQHAYSNLSVNANSRFFLGLRVGDYYFVLVGLYLVALAHLSFTATLPMLLSGSLVSAPLNRSSLRMSTITTLSIPAKRHS
jgi:hypothetical protein